MSRTIYIEKTATMTGYGVVFPDTYKDGDKLPTMTFLHGIGELSTKKSLQSAVDFHSWFKRATDTKKFIAILPQDDGTSLFDAKEIIQLKPIIEKYSNGQNALAGLSRGAGTTISIVMSNVEVKKLFSFYLVLCPPTWESLDEKILAADPTPMWIFAGAKDVADTATTIGRMVNTVDDMIKAGRKDNFYFSIFPNDDHFIWTEVMGAIGVPPINPANGATEWKGFNTTTTIVNGQPVSSPVAVTVPCVNDPSVDVYDFWLMQKPGEFKPLPRLSDKPVEQPVPDPEPAPTPTTPVYLSKIYIEGAATAKNLLAEIIWSDAKKEIIKAPTGVTIQYMIPEVIEGKKALRVKFSNKSTSTVYGPERK